MTYRTLLLIVCALAFLARHSASISWADPDGGQGSVKYTLPKERTTTGAAEDFTSRKIIGNWKEVCDTCTPNVYNSTPFVFTLGDGSNSLSITASADGARARVQDKATAPLIYDHTSQLNPPYNGPHGARDVTLSVGNTGNLGKTDSLAVGQTVPRAFAVQDIITVAADSLATLGGGTVPKGSDQPKQTLFFPKATGTTAFNAGTKLIGVLPHDALDVDVLLHEYGHSIGNKFNFDDPTVNGDHGAGREAASEKLAWGEGVATWLGVYLQDLSANKAAYSKMKYFGDTFYTDTEDLDIHYDIEGNQLGKLGNTKKVNSKGFKDELSVSRMLWDLYDNTPNEVLNDNWEGTEGVKDVVSFGSQTIWKLLNTKVTGAERGPYTLKELAENVRLEVSNDPGLGFWGKVGKFWSIGVLNVDHGLTAKPALSVPKPAPGGKKKITLEWSLAAPIEPDDIEGLVRQEEEGDPAVDGYDNFQWFRVVFADPLSEQIVGMTDWLSGASLFVPASTPTWQFELSEATYDALYGLDPGRRLKWFIQSESSEYVSPGLLPSDLFAAPISSAPAAIAIPEPTALVLALAVCGSMAMRRVRRL